MRRGWCSYFVIIFVSVLCDIWDNVAYWFYLCNFGHMTVQVGALGKDKEAEVEFSIVSGIGEASALVLLFFFFFFIFNSKSFDLNFNPQN